ncbi:uncharacterized protein LAESUDRAFT_761931 [Laetiporus sulphureus 93-53]|uniref:CxC2-like cysteine cluster KDZ transposase-associated domain-containing protein n=1 Tax=Laetiporus sulphureus 93-53 TaxID=1314785 RepID=A0A165CS81_9APHY|nr:uncharacterized protein LAESUDRAFT_761931 [Laetiporus sulphureus 93-53]KZT03347.1 hypothetical protein LAESUDRAFT_761931 [Laetiporus sulphureus 93-53]
MVLMPHKKESSSWSAQPVSILVAIYRKTGSVHLPNFHEYIGVSYRAFSLTQIAQSSWLYVLFFMVDANFHIHCKDRGLTDVHLSPGWAYYVEEACYLKHVEQHAHLEEENTCTAEHNAIIKANLHKEGYLASGVGAVLCARHAFVHKKGVGDLQKGEKFCNIDYLILSTLTSLVLLWLFLTYDIACQFSKNFQKRNATYREDLHLDFDRINIRWGIPKKHLPAHGPNHVRYSLNYVRHVGCTYGEGIESSWSHMNPIAMSTQEMGPTMHQEVLDDHWGAWNWGKIINLIPGKHMQNSYKEAVSMRQKHRDIFNRFSDTFAPAVIKEWEDIHEAWQQNHNHKPDPFEEPTSTWTMNAVCLQLAQEDAAEAARGHVAPHEVTASIFLQLGLELEGQVHVSQLKSIGKSDAMYADSQQRQNALYHHIQGWCTLQDIYMPIAAQLRAPYISIEEIAEKSDYAANDMKLWLPSSLSVDLRSSEALRDLVMKETRLRVAQADDALAEIRRLRHVLMEVRQFRKMNVSGTGQKANTRMRTLFMHFTDKIQRATSTYHVAHAALSVLDPGGDWSNRFLVLKEKHISGSRRDDDGMGEGRYELSWIWCVKCPDGTTISEEVSNTSEYNDSMCIEWACTKARADRWAEEKQLLEEEMR